MAAGTGAHRNACAQRHEAISELRPRLDLREDLELLGTDVRSGIDPDALAELGQHHANLSGQQAADRGRGPGRGRVCHPAWAGPSSERVCCRWWPLLPSRLRLRPGWPAESGMCWRPWISAGTTSSCWVELLDRLEREPFQSALLRQLRQALETEGRPASEQIQRLARRIHLLDTRKNMFFAPLAAVLLWKTQLAMADRRLARRRGSGDRPLAAAVGEFEALCALAAYCGRESGRPVS